MKEEDVLVDIKNMPIEKKLQMLSDADKEYVRSYVEQALLEQWKAQKNKENANEN
jgi:hypothetical protein